MNNKILDTLSATQIDVLIRLSNGWQLGRSSGFFKLHSRTWIQKGGIGKGGEAVTVPSATFKSLLDKKLIILTEERYPTRMYDAIKDVVKQFKYN